MVDSFYFCVTTSRTVGFGDPASDTTFGKIFTTVYIFVGLSLIAGFLNTVAEATLRGGKEEDAGKDDSDAHGG